VITHLPTRGLIMVALANAISGAAWSQTPATATPTVTTPQSPPLALSKTTAAAVEQRIASLRSLLGITEPQTPQWRTFAQAMRDNAAATEALFQQRASTAAKLNAVDNMRSYAQIARAYADGTDRLADAFATLYASLSDTQRASADKLFRQQVAEAAQPKQP
jgi:periplasmic protein CpxP/Spy